MKVEQIPNLIEYHRKRAENRIVQWDIFQRVYASEGTYNEIRGIAPDTYNDRNQEYIDQNEEPLYTVVPNIIFAQIDSLSTAVVPELPTVWVDTPLAMLSNAAHAWGQIVQFHLNQEGAEEVVDLAQRKASLFGWCFVKASWQSELNRTRFTVVDPRNCWIDETAERYRDIRYLIHRTFMPVEEFISNLKEGGVYDGVRSEFSGRDESSLRDPHPRELVGESDGSWDVTSDIYDSVTIYEFLDLQRGRYYHFKEGHAQPILEGELPYSECGNHFYLLRYIPNLKNSLGLSDATLIWPDLIRLIHLSGMEIGTALTSVPQTFVNTSLLDNADDVMTAMTDKRVPGDTIPVQTKHNAPLRDAIMVTETPSLSFSFNSAMSRTEGNIAKILGMPSFERGETGTVQVATEAAFANNSHISRNQKRQGKISSLIWWMGQIDLTLTMMYLPEDARIVVSLPGKKMKTFTREDLQIPEGWGLAGSKSLKDNTHYLLRVAPFNEVQSAKIVRLRTLFETYNALIQDPSVDKSAIAKEILRLVDLLDAVIEPQLDLQDSIPGLPTGSSNLGLQRTREPNAPPSLAGGDLPEAVAPYEEVESISGGRQLAQATKAVSLEGDSL